jgi:hypothetical protein
VRAGALSPPPARGRRSRRRCPAPMRAIAVTGVSPLDAARQRVRVTSNRNPPSSLAMSVPSSTGMSPALTVGRAHVMPRRAGLSAPPARAHGALPDHRGAPPDLPRPDGRGCRARGVAGVREAGVRGSSAPPSRAASPSAPAPAPASAASATSRTSVPSPPAAPARPSSMASTSTPTSGSPPTIASASNSSAAISSARRAQTACPPGRRTRPLELWRVWRDGTWEACGDHALARGQLARIRPACSLARARRPLRPPGPCRPCARARGQPPRRRHPGRVDLGRPDAPRARSRCPRLPALWRPAARPRHVQDPRVCTSSPTLPARAPGVTPPHRPPRSGSLAARPDPRGPFAAAPRAAAPLLARREPAWRRMAGVSRRSRGRPSPRPARRAVPSAGPAGGEVAQSFLCAGPRRAG